MSGATLSSACRHRSRRGSVLIIVLWICLGLIALTLYFANGMSSELRAADNRVAEASAREAVLAGSRYAAYVLTNFGTGGVVPNIQDYHAEALPVGDASFWLIGRDNDDPPTPTPYFALVDESSKLNLNTATVEMLEGLPNMTPDVAQAIYDWAHSGTASSSGAADNTYSQLDPPRTNKGAPFETIDELRLVYGMTLDLFLGEDTNRNGVLDPNEDDGDQSAPHDNQDGQLLAGISEYVTVYSVLPATSASGQRRINIRGPFTQQTLQALGRQLSTRGIVQPRLNQILARVGGNTFRSVMDFLVTTQMTPEEFALVHTDLTATASTNGTQQGLVNVNTASQTVLACIPGIGPDNAATISAYRLAHPDELTSFAWLTQILPAASLRAAGPYITDQSYQFTADVAAVGNNGRGYCRERFVFDTRSGTPRMIYRQDLTSFGWALGTDARQSLRSPKNT